MQVFHVNLIEVLDLEAVSAPAQRQYFKNLPSGAFLIELVSQAAYLPWDD